MLHNKILDKMFHANIILSLNRKIPLHKPSNPNSTPILLPTMSINSDIQILIPNIINIKSSIKCITNQLIIILS